ncbi:MAG: hypothetical protein Q7T81_10775 [Pseudolabrys sp.]|nr:hypothetical protein [Pseudolabrys sp.]
MKTLATMTAVAALVAGMSVASAQTTVSPGNPNAAATDTKQTGAQTNSGMQQANPAGSSAVKPTNTTDTSPAAPNASASGEAQAGKSGMQSTGTQTQSGGAMGAKPSTTGTGAPSPADTTKIPPAAVK